MYLSVVINVCENCLFGACYLYDLMVQNRQLTCSKLNLRVFTRILPVRKTVFRCTQNYNKSFETL